MTNKNNISKVNKPLQKALLLLLLFLLTLPCFALTIEGGVSYTEETARVEAFDGVAKHLTFSNMEQYYRSMFVAEIDYNNVLKIINYKASFMLAPMKITGVVYKDEPNKLYGYIKKNNGYECACVSITEGTEYPLKTRNYYAKTGELMSVGLKTPTEEYKYNKDGKLIGYWNANGKMKNYTKIPLKMKQLSVLDYGS